MGHTHLFVVRHAKLATRAIILSFGVGNADRNMLILFRVMIPNFQ